MISVPSVYKPFEDPRTQIRILGLLPGKYGDRLVGHFRTECLSSTIYEALSYTWGHTQREKAIYINNYQLPITDNLSSALPRLRRENVLRALCVDAICINQSDNVEKAHQISIMGNIYSHATSVVVWLGEYPNVNVRDAQKTRLPHWRTPIFGNAKLNARGLRFAEALEGALQAADTRWQDRLWIVQEFILARAIILFLGPLVYHLTSCIYKTYR